MLLFALWKRPFRKFEEDSATVVHFLINTNFGGKVRTLDADEFFLESINGIGMTISMTGQIKHITLVAEYSMKWVLSY